MNNSQFRNLVGGTNIENSQSSRDGSRKSLLGSRARPSVPMTPRSLGGSHPSKNLISQVAKHQQESSGEPPTKKFRSNAVPKGTQLASGYNDRSTERRGYNEDNEDDKVKRLKALEEMFKLQQIDQETFDMLKEELGVGGDISSTHMVKGLDWKLLERVRRGDDINASPLKGSEAAMPQEDVDDELERALEKDVQPVTREQTRKTQDEVEQETTTLPTSRDEILRQFKERRLNLASKEESVDNAAPVLSEKFRKFGEPANRAGKKKFTESVNGRRREVLLITDKEGNTKRKTRWLDPEQPTGMETEQAVWGGDVTAEVAARQKAFEEEQRRKAAEEEDDADGDIFANAGEYNPLAGLESDESDNAVDETTATSVTANGTQNESQSHKQSQPRNYFSAAKGERPTTEDQDVVKAGQDPNILAALKRAAQLRQQEQTLNGGTESSDDPRDPEQESKRRAFLAKLKERDRQDALDLDLGFGDSRMGDEDEDEDGVGEPLANWGDEDDGGRDAGGKKGGNARRRGPKKRKGDKNNVQDVLGVLQGRQKATRISN